MRGAISATSEQAFATTMERVHRAANRYDIATIAQLLIKAPHAHFSVRDDAFPKDRAVDQDFVQYSAKREDLEIALHSSKVRENAPKICSALEKIGEINEAALSGNLKSLEQNYEEYHKAFGYSRLVAMKAMSVRNSAAFKDHNQIRDQKVLGAYLQPRRDMGLAAFAATSDINRGYITNRRTLIEMANTGRLARPEALLVLDALSPLNFRAYTLADGVQRFGHEPLIDFVAKVFRVIDVLGHIGRQEDADEICRIMPSPIVEAWQHQFSRVPGQLIHEFVGSGDQFSDLQVYAHLPAWSEFSELYKFRLRIEGQYGSRIDYALREGSDYLSELTFPQTELAAIAELDAESHCFNSWPIPAGGFARTLTLLHSVEEDSLQITDGASLSRLLDRTIDIPHLLTSDEIEALLSPRPGDSLYQYLRAALLADADESPMRDHALRQALQVLLHEKYSGDIVSFIKDLDTEDGHVSKHLYQTCSETFLGKLYTIFPEADDVVEAHTQLLEWQGDRREDEDAKMQARSQRLLIRLRKVRGSIEETRLFVDPLWFMEWFHENIAEDLRNLQPYAEEIKAALPLRYVPNDPGLTVQPASQLQDILDRCYNEFCSNKIHGAGSYIGRRIRHGTFEGALVLELTPKVEVAIKTLREHSPRAASRLRTWFNEYKEAVGQFATNRLILRTKSKSDGLFIPSIADADKATVASIATETMARALSDNEPPAIMGSLLLDYCWVLIDADLERARRAVEQLRRRFLLDPDNYDVESTRTSKLVTACIRDLNSEMNQRFERAKGWLTRPTNFSPRASVSLIVDAVADEVGQRHPISLERSVPSKADIDLIGHRFHVFYDALFILMSNAAEYGANGTNLTVEVSAEFSDDDQYVDLLASIGSELRLDTKLENIRQIVAAMSCEVGEPMDQNRRSGIRKLRALSQNIEEIASFGYRTDGNQIIFDLGMRYRLSRTSEPLHA